MRSVKMRSGLCAMLLCASPAAARAQLLPGDASLSGEHIKFVPLSYHVTMTAGGKESDMGTVTYDLTRLYTPAPERLLFVQTMRGAGGNTTDTVGVAVATMAPISLRGYTPAGTMSLDYSGNKVSGEQRDPEGSAHAIAETLSRPAFDGNMLELILAVLPLKEGYSARIPMYTNERGIAWYDVTVKDAAQTWDVTVKSEEGTARYTISKKDQWPVSAVITSAFGSVVKMVRN